MREIAIGKSAEEAARSSFTGLLVPGTLALVTALVSFVTLLLIPIPMVRELAITASLGVAYKIVTNLVMLPLMASLLRVDDKYAAAQEVSRQRRSRWPGPGPARRATQGAVGARRGLGGVPGGDLAKP